MPYNNQEIRARKPARNYRDPNDKEKRTEQSLVEKAGQHPPGRPKNKSGGSEQPGYRMKRAPFWQS